MWPTYYYADIISNLFSPIECNDIIKIESTRNQQKISLMTNRDSNIYWMNLTSDNGWIFDRLWKAVETYNQNFHFSIHRFDKPIQLTHYKQNQFYNWHMDLGEKEMSRRKISIIVELSQNDNPVSGGLEIFRGDETTNAFRLSCGSAAIFPSWIMHRAMPVIDEMGEPSCDRWSLVQWIEGLEPFK